MVLKKLFTIFLLVCLISCVSASSLGIFQKDSCVNLLQICDNCTYVNLTSVMYPNSTFVLKGQYAMTKTGEIYNYTFCNTTAQGTYIYTSCGDDDGVSTCSSVSFEVTYNGTELNTQKSILYLGLIVILIFLFLIVVFSIPHLPKGDNYSEEGMLININNLKYLRHLFFGVAWGLLMGIVFMVANISIAYLPFNMFGEFFFMLYKIMMVLTLPMVFIWFIYIIASILKDKEFRSMIERGVDISSGGWP